jgi:DNA-binding NarL/FixJ family response regulator
MSQFSRSTARRPCFSVSQLDYLQVTLRLSPKQKEIITLLLEAKSDKQIAESMRLALPTVRTHLSRLFTRTGAADRVELVLHIFATLEDFNPPVRMSSRSMT